MKNSVSLSLEKSVNVRGYEIRRLPLGKYLEAIEALRTTPEKMMHACFPGMDAGQALEKMKHMDAQALGEMAMRAATVAPREAIRLLAVVTGIEEKALMEDEDIGLDGAAEMAAAFWRVNNMENFLNAAKELAAQIKAAAGKKDGYNG